MHKSVCNEVHKRISLMVKVLDFEPLFLIKQKYI